MEKIDISDDIFDFLTDENFEHVALVVPYERVTDAMKKIFADKAGNAGTPTFVVAGAMNMARNTAEKFGVIKFAFQADHDDPMDAGVFFV